MKIIPFGESGSELYCVMVCDIGEYRVFKKFDYFSNSFIVSTLNGCKAGDTVEIKKYYHAAYDVIHYDLPVPDIIPCIYGLRCEPVLDSGRALRNNGDGSNACV